MTVTVSSILEWLDNWAPFESAEEWDNVGLLAGSRSTRVQRVITALDINRHVVEQAVSYGAQLIISHHPVIFKPLKNLDGQSVAYNLARHNLAAVCAHTNLDKAKGGVNDLLAKALELQEIHTHQDGLCRTGILNESMQPLEFAKYVHHKLNIPDNSIMCAQGSSPVKTVTICAGAGGDSINTQSDAFVTGELHYHEWPSNPNATLVAAGHFYTEVLIAQEIALRIKKAFPTLEVTAAKEKCPYTCFSF